MKVTTTLSLAVALSVASVAVAIPFPHGDDEMSGMTNSHKDGSSDSTSHSSSDDSHLTVNNSTVIEPAPFKAGGHHHGMPILMDPNLEPQQRAYWEAYNTTTYFNAPAPNKGFFWGHVILTVVAWAFLYPVSMLLSIDNSVFYLPLQSVQYATFMASLFCLAVYGSTAPRDLYPNNAYSRMSVAMLFLSSFHYVSAVIKALADWALTSARRQPMDGADYVLANLSSNYNDLESDLHTINSGDSHELHQLRHSQDSGHALSFHMPVATSDSAPLRDDVDGETLSLDPARSRSYSPDVNRNTMSSSPLMTSNFELRQDRLVATIMNIRYVSGAVQKLNLAASIIYAILNRPLFVVGFGYLVLGAATVYRMGMSNNVFNLLAHYIKGGVFFLFGLLTLGRYLGAFADKGMAWNLASTSSRLAPSKSDPADLDDYNFAIKARKARRSRIALILSKFKIPTMEYAETGLIFIYGISNIFLEHLGNEDGKWSHKDLQHISIAFMYLGGGLAGLLVESATVRRLLSRSLSTDSSSPKGISFNPFPAFVVFWTGALMSQHEQMLPLSTSIHMQWGYLLSSSAIFRLGTYALLYLNPPQSTEPTRPFTEIVTSFCLIAGGLVFMQSNSETVEAMIYRGLDSMFTLNVTVGITALIMSFEIVAMTLKGAAKKYARH